MVDAALFIGAAIAGITELVKQLAPNVRGAVTVIVAVAVGVLVALLDGTLGITNISVAQGIMIAFSAVGVVATAKKVG